MIHTSDVTGATHAFEMTGVTRVSDVAASKHT